MSLALCCLPYLAFLLLNSLVTLTAVPLILCRWEIIELWNIKLSAFKNNLGFLPFGKRPLACLGLLMGINGHGRVLLEPACLPGGKNSLNSHRWHSRTSANHFPTGYRCHHKACHHPWQRDPHTFPWQRSGCRRSTWVFRQELVLVIFTLVSWYKRPLEFLSLWKSMGLYFLFKGVFYALQWLLRVNFGLNINRMVCAFGGVGGVISNILQGPEENCHFACLPSLLTNHGALTPYLNLRLCRGSALIPGDS